MIASYRVYMENKIDPLAFTAALNSAFNKEREQGEELIEWQKRALKAEEALIKAEAEIERLRTRVITSESR